MSVPGIHEIQALAIKYSKPQLAHMAQTGLIDTQKAVLAAMMRDRIAKEDAKPPISNVAQDALGLQPPQMAQAAPQQMPQMAQAALQQHPQMGMPATPAPEMPEQMAATGGLTSIPIPAREYAGGGIVAFADGGDTKREGQYEYVFDPATGTYKEIGAPKEIPIPKDTRQHIGPAGYGLFGSEGMDMMTGLPKGNLRDPVLGFAKGGDTPYKVYDYQPNLIEETPISTFDLEKQRQQEAARAFGVDPDFYKKRGEEVGLEREKLGKEKSTAWMDALIAGGLGAAAGNSPYALQNIATGATKGFETYQGQMKDIRERDKALLESQNKIKEADYLRSIGQADAADKAIQESKKLNREAKNANIGIKNEIAKETAKAKTEAEKTRYTEGAATGRTAMQIAAQKEIAQLPGHEQKLLEDVYQQEKEKNPAVTKLDVYNKMHPTGQGSPYARAQMALQYDKEWNDMQENPVALRAFQKQNPLIKTSDDYVKHKMELLDAYVTKTGTAAPPPVGAQLSAEDQQALAWANANPSDPRAALIKTRLGR